MGNICGKTPYHMYQDNKSDNRNVPDTTHRVVIFPSISQSYLPARDSGDFPRPLFTPGTIPPRSFERIEITNNDSPDDSIIMHQPSSNNTSEIPLIEYTCTKCIKCTIPFIYVQCCHNHNCLSCFGTGGFYNKIKKDCLC